MGRVLRKESHLVHSLSYAEAPSENHIELNVWFLSGYVANQNVPYDPD